MVEEKSLDHYLLEASCGSMRIFDNTARTLSKMTISPKTLFLPLSECAIPDVFFIL